MVVGVLLGRAGGGLSGGKFEGAQREGCWAVLEEVEPWAAHRVGQRAAVSDMLLVCDPHTAISTQL